MSEHVPEQLRQFQSEMLSDPSLGCHTDTLRRKANAGELKTIRVGRRVLIPASELQRIVAEGL